MYYCFNSAKNMKPSCSSVTDVLLSLHTLAIFFFLVTHPELGFKQTLYEVKVANSIQK